MLNFLKRILTKRRQRDEEIELPKHLTKDERKEIKAIVKAARKNDGSPRTARKSRKRDLNHLSYSPYSHPACVTSMMSLSTIFHPFRS